MHDELERVLHHLSDGAELVARPNGISYVQRPDAPLLLVDRPVLTRLKREGWVQRVRRQPNPFVKSYRLSELGQTRLRTGALTEAA